MRFAMNRLLYKRDVAWVVHVYSVHDDLSTYVLDTGSRSALTGHKFLNSPAHIQTLRSTFTRSCIIHVPRHDELIRGAATLGVKSDIKAKGGRNTDVVNRGPIPSPVHGVEGVLKHFILGYGGDVLRVRGR